MKNKFFLLLALGLGFLFFVATSCEEESEDEEVCMQFDEGIPASCEPPTLCEPLEEGANGYIVNPDGSDYYCDMTEATDADPYGCSDAEDQYINEHCETALMTKAEIAEFKMKFTDFTKQLMEKARQRSVCY